MRRLKNVKIWIYQEQYCSFCIIIRFRRAISNAILIANGYCPLSFRSVDSIDYKKAMLIFYEQNNLYAFKQIFIDQFDFAVREYF